MYTEGYDQWFKLNKNLTAPYNEWNKVTNDIFKRIASQNLELIGESYSRFSDRLKRLSSIKKPEDFLILQKDILNEDLSLSLEYFQKIIHLYMENMEELAKLWGTTAAKVTEKAVEKAQKFGERAER
jgi:NDP-sugar pyrophosphorylase family protein